MNTEKEDKVNQSVDQEKRLHTEQALSDLKNEQTSEVSPVQVQVGLAKFKQRFSLKKKRQIIDKRKQGIFQADNWFIGTSYYREQWNQLFPHIESATCSSIVVQFDQCPTILLDFSRPRFICLRQLTLVFNGIENIEALSFINAEFLTTLNLQGNVVTNTRTLNKLMFLKMDHLDLSKNFFNQVDANRFKSNNQSFTLDFLVHEWDRELQSISFCAKVQRKKLTVNMKSTMNSFSGIKPSYAVVQKNVCRALKRKFNEQKIQAFLPQYQKEQIKNSEK